MRIVEYGHIKPREVKCNHCGAILEYLNTDLHYMRDVCFLVCPVCDKTIVKDNDGKKFTMMSY